MYVLQTSLLHFELIFRKIHLNYDNVTDYRGILFPVESEKSEFN